MNAQRAPSPFCQNVKVSARLCCLDHSEGIFLLRNGQFNRVIASDLKKHARIWPALIRLSGRVQEPRPEAEAGRDMLPVSYGMSNRLQRRFMFGIHLDVCQHCEIIASVNAV